MGEREVIQVLLLPNGHWGGHTDIENKGITKMPPPNSLLRPPQSWILNIFVGTAFITYLYKESKESERSWRVYRRKCRLKWRLFPLYKLQEDHTENAQYFLGLQHHRQEPTKVWNSHIPRSMKDWWRPWQGCSPSNIQFPPHASLCSSWNRRYRLTVQTIR